MQGTHEPTADATPPEDFPRLDSLAVRLPIASNEWTIWPGPRATTWDFVRGFPLELHPFAWDYVRVSSDGRRVQLEPHYLESTFDTFWMDTRGHVTCHALRGLFPFTLGRQPELLEGVDTTLTAMARLVEPSNPGAAKAILQIAARFGALAVELRQVPDANLRREIEDARRSGRATPRGRAAEQFWLAKRERSRRRKAASPAAS